MICRKLYHWMIGCLFSALDIGRDEGLPRMSPERVREVVRTVSDRARANDRGIAEELLASHAPPDPRQAILADPRMDGTTWIPAADLSQSLLDSWPGWERSHPAGVGADASAIPGTLISLKYAEPWQYRPLRMAGMDDSGDGKTRLGLLTDEARGRCDWHIDTTNGWYDLNIMTAEWLADPENDWAPVRPAIWRELDKS